MTAELAWLHDDTSSLHDLYDDSDGLAHLARHAGAALEGAPAEEIVRWAVDRFGAGFVIASSMADAVLAHLASKVAPGVNVVFLDTGYHFAETIGTSDAVEAVYPITLHRVKPELSVKQQDAVYGRDLFARDPDACCAMRKVQPLRRALAPYTAWASGIRRDEASSRAGIGVVEWDAGRGKVKVNPLAAWTQADVEAYIERHGVIVNPLVSEGYDSIGCKPCTKPGAGRDGRWAGSGKVECGLHV